MACYRWLFEKACLITFLLVLAILPGCAMLSEDRFDEPESLFPDPVVVSKSSAKGGSESPLFDKRPDYLLGPEDVIEVLVWKDESLTRTVTVRPDGKISLPLIGEVQAAGLTPAEISSIVRHRLQKFYKEPPEVSVVVTGINSVSVFILGEVVTPGKQILRRETTLLQGLSLVGGFKEFADKDHILLIRKEGFNEQRILIRYKDIIKGKHPEKNYWLKAGDTIVVP